MPAPRVLFATHAVSLFAAFLLVGPQALALNPDRQLDQYRADIWVFKDGLPRSRVTSIAQTPDGYLWLGTRLGLVRFDGATFHRFGPSASGGNAPGSVYSMAIGPSGTLWIGTDSKGFGEFRADSYMRFVTGPDDKQWSRTFATCWTRNGLFLAGGHHAVRIGVLYFVRQGKLIRELVWPHGYIRSVVEDRTGDLWCAIAEEGLVQLTPDGRIKRTFRLRDGLPDLKLTSFGLDANGDLWLGTEKHGICRFRNGAFNAFTTRQGLPSDEITCLCPTREGSVWVGTTRGMARWRAGRWQAFRSVGGQEEAPIDSIFEDREGSLWVSTKGGLIRYCNTKLIPIHTPASPHSAPICVTLGPDGNFWAGTNDAGIIRPNENGTCDTRLTTVQGLPNNHADSLCTTPDGTLWIATTGFLVRYANGKATKFPIGSSLRFIRPDTSGDLFAIDMIQNLYRFHQGKQVFIRHMPGTGWPFCFQVDADHCVWIGTDTGLYRYQGNTLNRVEGWPQGRNALCMTFTPDGKTVWVGTDQGIARYDGRGLRFYTSEQGLPENESHLIALDRFGTLWLSGNTGIVSFHARDLDALDTGTLRSLPFQRYTQEDGFSDADVTDEAVQDHDGRIVFANHAGFTLIAPAHLPFNPYAPPVTLESAAANGKSVPLDRSMVDRSMKAAPGEGALEVHFAAMSFVAPEKVRFRYRLEGHDTEWIEAGTRRDAYYTNLPPGAYRFRVVACNNDGVWNQQGAAFSIVFLPHFWQTVWFRLLCGAAGLMLAAAGFRWRFGQMIQRTQQLDAQNKEMNALNTKLQRLNELKDEFLANTSHELRTPLNGMIGIAESMLDGAIGPLTGEQQYNMKLLAQSGKRLTNLVNDILDFSKLRHHELSLNLRPVSLREIVEMVLQIDRMLVGSKALQLINAVPATLPLVLADENRLQQILHNLIGNAIKFTPSGTVTVSAAILPAEAAGRSARSGAEQVAISVTDTGIGIPAERLDRVFESFEQVEGSARRQYGGTGLGLAITRSLLELHGGQIRVDSEQGRGSIFTFILPLCASGGQEAPAQAADSQSLSDAGFEPVQEPFALAGSEDAGELSAGGLVPHILVVDDEPVNLQVVKNFLKLEHYRITLASDGQQALALLDQGIVPDIILLDVMMPRMTGYEVVQIIRQKLLADRLPIILLSARDQPEDVVMGLGVGANDYLTKPISKKELVARIHTHLQIRQSIEARQRMESELAIAAQIQRSMVPPIALADSPDPRYRLAGLFQPARMVGGDLYDFFLLGEDRLCVVIGDVADKGIPAALLMARTVTLIRTLARQMSTPVEILNAVNHELCANNAECLFVTVLCGILNLETGRFHYASAGHDPALLIRGQEVRFLELETGPPIGLEEKAVFPQFECSLMPDDLILFYTDGITEAMNPQGELFSEGRLTAVLSGNVPADPAQTIEAIQSAYGQFVADAAQSDDLTLLALVYRGAVSRSGAAQAGECSLTIDSELIELDRVKRRLAEFFETHALAQEVIEDADLIVEELLVNIMHYGYADEAGHAIEFRVALTPVCLKITCEDRGRPFNPLTEIAAPDLTADDETRSSGGFGFYLVRQLSTHVEYLYQDGKNVLVIYRSIGRENRISCTEDEQQ